MCRGLISKLIFPTYKPHYGPRPHYCLSCSMILIHYCRSLRPPSPCFVTGQADNTDYKSAILFNVSTMMMILEEEYHHVHSLELKLIISLLIYVINRHVHRLEVFTLPKAWHFNCSTNSSS